ncbi:unnamed protein product [Phyllotreta striolata]|uniref:Uncharacterized protein n=1 Tax=Phyllotreta striolata TaxID=444603 RepID=A0A9N9TKS5_PHYSR|nr:unnamed protein product [Phyllotreta striolata]
MALKLVLFFAAMVLANAAQNPGLESDPNPNYSYSYNVQDKTTGDNKNHLENRNGNVVRGQYSLDDPDGTRRTVQYTADPLNGFVAIVKKEPLVAVQQPVQQQQQFFAPLQLQQLQLQQPLSLYQERLYIAQPAVQQQQQQPAQKLQSQRQQADREDVETTTIEAEELEPTTTEAAPPSSGYYYPKPAKPAALFAKKEPSSSRRTTPGKAEKLELEEPMQANPAVAQRGSAPVSVQYLSAPYVQQQPIIALSSPYSYSTLTVF